LYWGIISIGFILVAFGISIIRYEKRKKEDKPLSKY
jgi:hypothetical protein